MTYRERDLFAYVTAWYFAKDISRTPDSNTDCDIISSITNYAKARNIDHIQLRETYFTKWVEWDVLKVDTIEGGPVLFSLNPAAMKWKKKEYKGVFDLMYEWIKRTTTKSSDVDSYNKAHIDLIFSAKLELGLIDKYGPDYTINDIRKYEYPSVLASMDNKEDSVIAFCKYLYPDLKKWQELLIHRILNLNEVKVLKTLVQLSQTPEDDTCGTICFDENILKEKE